MGYTLEIGEAIIVNDSEGNHISIGVELLKHDNAPAYGEPTDYENQRWPSYSSWDYFCRFAGLYELFYDKCDGLIRNHPGESPINLRVKKEVDAAYQKLKEKYPNVKAGYSPKINFSKGIYEDKDWPEENNCMVRMEWLKYWVDWSLENCKNPIIKNT